MSRPSDREAFERWMLDVRKCVVGSADPYPAGIERDAWQAWQAGAANARAAKLDASGDPVEREAQAMFERTTEGWRNVTAWADLHDDTREIYRDRVRRTHPPVESAPGFYLASFKRRSIDGMVTWWAPGSCGYTTDLNTAGVYCDEANANEYTVPVPVAFIDSLRVRRVIDPGDTGNEAFHSAAHLRDALLAAAPAAAQENAP